MRPAWRTRSWISASRSGDRVAVQAEKSPEGVALYLGCLMAGAVYLPLNTAYTRAELDYFVADSEPKVLVVDPARREAVRDIGGESAPQIETLGASGRGLASRAGPGRAAGLRAG